MIRPFKTRLSRSCLLGCFSVLPLQAADNFPDYSMVLVGGGLSTCSSMTPSLCAGDLSFDAAALHQLSYRWSREAQQRIATWSGWSDRRASVKQQLLQGLAQLPKTQRASVLTKAELLRLLGDGLVAQLSDAEFNLLLDQLEQPAWISPDQPGAGRQREQVRLTDSKDKFSVEIYKKIVEQAAKISKSPDKPKLLVLTASSRDPFAAVDFYLELFRQAGAEVEWLPLNAAWQQAQQSATNDRNGCQQLDQYLAELHQTYRRSAVYPDLYQQFQQFCMAGSAAALDKIRGADALFFNGGNQSLTLAAFLEENGETSAELALIRQQVEQGRLIVAGTSAGTAVMAGGIWQGQPVPMISNGSSRAALQFGAVAAAAPDEGCDIDQSCPAGLSSEHLTYRPAGGLGLFRYGVLDTHFSERGRQGRLMQLLQSSGSQFGFGVDEATALLVGWPQGQPEQVRMRVTGAAGVYVLAQKQDNTEGEPLVMTSHYLSRDDELQLNNGQLRIKFADWKQARPAAKQRAAATELQRLDWLQHDQYRQLAGQFCQTGQPELQAQEPKTGYLLSLKLQSQSQLAFGQYQRNSQSTAYCSYQAVQVQISQQR